MGAIVSAALLFTAITIAIIIGAVSIIVIVIIVNLGE